MLFTDKIIHMTCLLRPNKYDKTKIDILHCFFFAAFFLFFFCFFSSSGYITIDGEYFEDLVCGGVEIATFGMRNQ